MGPQGLPSARIARPSAVNNEISRDSRALLSSASPSPSRTTRLRSVAARRTNARLHAAANSGPIIMTKAQQQRRRTALLATSSKLLRSIGAVERDGGPALATRIVTPFQPTKILPRQQMPRRTETNDSPTAGHVDTESRATPATVRVVKTATRRLPHDRKNSSSQYALRGQQQQVLSSLSAHSNPKDARGTNRVKFNLGDYAEKSSIAKVLTSEKNISNFASRTSIKILPRIIGLMSWNELLPLRSVCKAWFQIIDSDQKIKSQLGVIVLRSPIEQKMTIYNTGPVTWTKFRFIGPVIFDMTKSIQNDFWNKHGSLMIHLDIHNRSMSLTALVEILARCPKLEHFKCNWTPEMYSFNSELIKKYYGIHFNNGTFANLQELTISSSSSLTDTALWSILKWCGGSIKSLNLTSSPEEDILHRLKPRWCMDSIKNYFDRFGYTRKLQYLDFSWTNLVNDDLRSLCSIVMDLKGITLNYCKVDDEGLQKLLQRHGDYLEVFKIEGTAFTDAIFAKGALPKVRVLHIGGLKGMVKSLGFLEEMPCLEDLSCRSTQWLEQSMILRPFNTKSKQTLMKAIDFSGDFTGLVTNLRELNLSHWSSFGTNQNFKNICETLTLLEKLSVREWDQLSDVGTTGLYEEEIHQDWGAKLPLKPRVYIGALQRIKHLDLSGTAITDATLFLALCTLTNLRSVALDSTRVTDYGLRGLITKIQSLDRISVSKCPRISVTQPRYKRPDGRIVFFGKI